MPTAHVHHGCFRSGPQGCLSLSRGTLRLSEGEQGSSRPNGAERRHTWPKLLPSFLLLVPGGLKHWAVPPGCGPCLPVPGGVKMVRGAHSTVPDHLCHHPRPPSQADAVKVILHLSSCSHREIKARVVGMVKREPNYIYNIKVSAFVACCSPGFFISRKTQISIFHFHILTRKIACSQLRPIAFGMYATIL